MSIAIATLALIGATTTGMVSGALGRAVSASSPPTVETGPVQSIGPRGGIASGVIDPNGHLVRYWVAFGRKRPSEHHTGLSEERVSGTEPGEVGEVLENLREGTTYRYRMVVVYAHQTKKVFGLERSFTTKCYFKDSTGEIGVRKCRR